MRQLGQYGLVQPVEDRVVDRFKDIRVGSPERVAWPTGAGRRDDPPAPAALSRVLANRLLGISEDWNACEGPDLVDMCPDFRGPIRQALADLVNEGLLAKIEDVYYLADAGMRYATGRERTSVLAARRRGQSFLDPDMQWHRHHLDHHRGLIRAVRALKAHGIRVYGGWRGVVHIHGVTQVQPDGVMYADGSLGRSAYHLEFERSAVGPEQILDKLGPYRRAAEAGVPLRVVWVCETRRAMARFRRLSRGLQAMVTTLADLEAGMMAGPATAWRSADGENIQLRPY